jgi:predicted PurR-regulated permease PerM
MSVVEIILVAWCFVFTVLVIVFFSRLITELHNIVSVLKVIQEKSVHFAQSINQISEKQETDREDIAQLKSDLRITHERLRTLNNWAQLAGYSSGDRVPNVQNIQP